MQAAAEGLERRAATCRPSRQAPSSTGSWNEHYPDAECFLFAIADALHEEYKAITDAGFILQIDDPDLPDGWQMYPEMSVADYRTYADLRVAAINRALEGIPEEQVRLHVCWGSGHGPHRNDIPLERHRRHRAQGRAQCYSVEAANPMHEYELARLGDDEAARRASS